MKISNFPILLAATPASAGNGSPFADSSTLIDLNYLLTHGREGFCAFTVTGDSQDPRIPPGSLVVCDTVSVPEDGDTVVVEHDQSIYVKILELKPLRLVSSNESYEPMSVREHDSFCVLGVVIASLNLHRRSARMLRMVG
jgi:SOS-response transcriptional repressor LexA